MEINVNFNLDELHCVLEALNYVAEQYVSSAGDINPCDINDCLGSYNALEVLRDRLAIEHDTAAKHIDLDEELLCMAEPGDVAPDVVAASLSQIEDEEQVSKRVWLKCMYDHFGCLLDEDGELDCSKCGKHPPCDNPLLHDVFIEYYGTELNKALGK